MSPISLILKSRKLFGVPGMKCYIKALHTIYWRPYKISMFKLSATSPTCALLPWICSALGFLTLSATLKCNVNLPRLFLFETISWKIDWKEFMWFPTGSLYILFVIQHTAQNKKYKTTIILHYKYTQYKYNILITLYVCSRY